MTRFAKVLSRFASIFRRDCRGNVAVIFALAILPLIGMVGASIDYSRASSMKTKFQDALDATALMLSKEASADSSTSLQTNATKYFKALFNQSAVSNISISASYTSGSSKIAVSGTGSMPTNFMKVLGYNNITIGGTSTTAWGSNRLRVALVLDNTGSMAESGKMTALKTATKSLLTQLQSAATTNGDVYVSIVPFSKDVNVGSSNYTSSWIDWTDWDSANGSSASTFSGSVCINGTLYKVSGSSFTSGGNCTGTGPGICYKGTLWMWSGSTFYTSGSCSSGTAHANWNGCITDRGGRTAPDVGNYDQTIATPTAGVTASLYPAEQYPACPVAMKPLSYDWTGMNSLVDSMTPNGYTNQPIGLVWGWLTLAGGGVFSVPAMDSNYTYNQIIILLSDGLNTEDRWYITQTPIDNRMYQTGNNSGTCANIKAAGITIYTIQVNTGGDPTSTLLKNCASGTDKFFLLTSASQIVTTFQSIATNLTQLRIAK